MYPYYKHFWREVNLVMQNVPKHEYKVHGNSQLKAGQPVCVLVAQEGRGISRNIIGSSEWDLQE